MDKMDETIAEETTQELEAVENKESTEAKPEETTETTEKPAEEATNKPSEEATETETKEGESKAEEPVTEEAKPAEAENLEEKEKKEGEGGESTEVKPAEEEKKQSDTTEVKEESSKSSEETKEARETKETKETHETKKTKESKSAKNSNVRLNEPEIKNVSGSKSKLTGSNTNLQKRRLSKDALNKFKSKSNLYGSISNLRGSKYNLSGSRNLYGSSMILNKSHLHEQNQEPTDRITFENTYQLKPEKKFSSYEVKKMLDEYLQKKFVTIHQEEDEDPETIYFQYETKKAQDMSKQMANEILEEVKKFEYDRYKLVVDVTIGEYTGQGVRVSSRAIWDTSTDSYASSSYRHGNVFVTAIVFACYYE